MILCYVSLVFSLQHSPLPFSEWTEKHGKYNILLEMVCFLHRVEFRLRYWYHTKWIYMKSNESSNMHGVINTVHKLSNFIGSSERAGKMYSDLRKPAHQETQWPDWPHYSILVVLSLVFHVYLARWTSVFFMRKCVPFSRNGPYFYTISSIFHCTFCVECFLHAYRRIYA